MSITCNVCGGETFIDQAAYKKHKTSKAHKRKLRVYCNICNGRMFQTREIYLEHAASKKHLKRQLEQQQARLKVSSTPGARVAASQTSAATVSPPPQRQSMVAKEPFRFDPGGILNRGSLLVYSPPLYVASSSYVLAKPSVPSLRCEECKETITSLEDMDQHYVDSSAHPHCSICNSGFKNEVSLKEHISTEHEPRCRICMVTFESDEDLSTHLRDPSVASHVVCFRCDEGFQDRQTWNEHNSSVHPMVLCSTCRRYVCLDEMGEHFKDSANHPTCSICDEGFENNISFHQHALSEHPELCCDLCGLAFVSSELISRHFHESPLHPSCNDCSIGFRDPADFNEHVKDDHTFNPEDDDDASTSPLSDLDEVEQESTNEVEQLSMAQSASRASSEPMLSQAGSVFEDDRSFSNQSVTSDLEVTPLEALPSPAASEGSLAYSSDGDTSGPITPQPDVFMEEPQLAPHPDLQPTVLLSSSPKARSLVLSELRLNQYSPTHPSARVVASKWEVITEDETTRGPANLISSPRASIYGLIPSNITGSVILEEQVNGQPHISKLAPTSSEANFAATPKAQQWSCRVCLRDPHEPTATLCGHIFCRSCISQELRKSLRCPVCRKDMLIRLHVEASH